MVQKLIKFRGILLTFSRPFGKEHLEKAEYILDRRVYLKCMYDKKCELFNSVNNNVHYSYREPLTSIRGGAKKRALIF